MLLNCMTSGETEAPHNQNKHQAPLQPRVSRMLMQTLDRTNKLPAFQTMIWQKILKNLTLGLPHRLKKLAKLLDRRTPRHTQFSPRGL